MAEGLKQAITSFASEQGDEQVNWSCWKLLNAWDSLGNWKGWMGWHDGVKKKSTKKAVKELSIAAFVSFVTSFLMLYFTIG